MQLAQLKSIIEAALLAHSQPMSVSQLSELFVEDDAVDRTQLAQALQALADDCEGRGVELREVASGFRYQVRQETHHWISRMWTEKPSRYSRALLETLALIAYRQPITRPEIEQIRGVVVSSNIIKTLEEREWIRVVGHRDVPGRPALFGTTRAFLDYFTLRSLDELPPLSAIRDMEDPQLRLPEEAIPARAQRELSIDPDGPAEDEATLAAQSADNDTSAEIENRPADPAYSLAPAAPLPRADPLANLFASDDDDDDESESADASTHRTADEAENPADADHGDAEQDNEEYRA
ncbi:MAG: SMC-Scp complex subunit ScpB [Dyella sp.]